MDVAGYLAFLLVAGAILVVLLLDPKDDTDEPRRDCPQCHDIRCCPYCRPWRPW